VRLNVEGLFVNVSGVTTEEDALFAIGLGASAVGFDFMVSPRQISVVDARDIVRRLPPGAMTVGVFRNELASRVVEVANTLGLSAVQIDGPATLDHLLYVTERVNTVFRTLPATREDLTLDGGVDYLVLPERDTPDALVDALELFRSSSPRAPIIASGGLDPLSVADVVQNFPVFGVDARAGVESSPGVKDPGLLGDFIANARWAYEHSFVERHFDEWTL